MDLENMTAQEVRDRIMKHSRSIKDDEWLEISEWINKFLKKNPPLEEKKMFIPLGCAEIVTIMCDGIMRWRNSICIKCKKQQGCGRGCCSVYQQNENYTGGIPNDIWANENAKCPYFEEEL